MDSCASSHAIRRHIAAGAALYRRDTVLRLLIPAGGSEPDREIIRMLQRARRGEIRRGRAGHWSYSMARQIGLSQALLAEVQAYRYRMREARRAAA